MSFSAETNISMLPDIYQFSLNLIVGLPNLAIIADVTKNNNISQKDKMLVYSLTFAAMLAIVYSNNTMPLGLVLSIAAIVMVKKLDKEINCVLYSTLLAQNVLLGILMGTQYMLKNN